MSISSQFEALAVPVFFFFKTVFFILLFFHVLKNNNKIIIKALQALHDAPPLR